MKKLKKQNKLQIFKLLLFTTIFVFMLFTLMSTNTSFAESNPIDTKGIGPVFNVDNPDEIGEDSAKTLQLVLKIIEGLQWFGMALAVIMLIWLGAEYFMKSHDPSKKAELNNRLSSIFIGFLLIIGALFIVLGIGQIIKGYVN